MVADRVEILEGNFPSPLKFRKSNYQVKSNRSWLGRFFYGSFLSVAKAEVKGREAGRSMIKEAAGIHEAYLRDEGDEASFRDGIMYVAGDAVVALVGSLCPGVETGIKAGGIIAEKPQPTS